MSWVKTWDDLRTDERIPRWPSKVGEKRPVSVKINSWVGISIGAKHTYLEIEENKQEYWSEKENCWVEVLCDSEAKGFSLKAEVYTEEEAILIANEFLKLMFHKKTHVLNWDGPGKPKIRRKKNVS